tara:strand:- start:453 stop:638 length:186 start_codon:yes stop_codon:yes gene_type:complete
MANQKVLKVINVKAGKNSEKKQEKREARKLSREKAVCKYCNKDTFTSMKQLQLHIPKKHDV